MRLNIRQRADWVAHVLKAGFQQHHTALVPLFRPYIPQDAVVIDIGAHAGQFSKLFADMAPRGHVWSFEPSAYARSVMTAARTFHRKANITLTPAGLSDAPGELVLHTPVKKAGGLGFGVAHLGPDDGSRETVEQTVKLLTLDSFVAEHGLTRIDFIKADVEGWELHALRGGEQALARFKPVLYLEVHDDHLRRAGGSAVELFEWLGARGYQALRVPALTPTPVFVESANFLFVPKAA